MSDLENKKRAFSKSAIAPRSFNTLEFEKGRVTKTSTRHEKFYDEIRWFKCAPESVRQFLPKVHEASLAEGALKLTLEQVMSPTLSELFLDDALELEDWRKILTTLLEKYMSTFRGVRPVEGSLVVDEVERAFRAHYVDKTLTRIRALNRIREFDDMMGFESVRINGEACVPFHLSFLPLAERMLPRVCRALDLSFIHGDFCFSNILFNVSQQTFKVIDPRGSFGSYKDVGDYKYDMAKLFHSGAGLYDLITNDRFDLRQKGNAFELEFDVSERQKAIGALLKELIVAGSHVDHKELLFIEAALFCSMLPLHADSLPRMKAFYCIASQKVAQLCSLLS